MKERYFSALLAVLLGAAARGQVPLNSNPSRVVGHAELAVATGNPNLVEGRELYSPQGLALDTSVTPPILYVSDTGNNRVMAWKNAAQFANGAPADLIIGQKDRFSTFAQGPRPGTAFSVGLSSPTGLAVRDGNLYVVDSGNNRILRFPSPMAQSEQFPDLVIGQPNFMSGSANQGGSTSRRTLALSASSTTYRATPAFDAAGNLWVTDPGNNRVLRFPQSSIAAGSNGPDADLVLGQVDFDSVATALAATVASQQQKDRVQAPGGLAFDAAGRLYVSDSLQRVLVFAPPFANNMMARRVLGVVPAPAAGQAAITQAVLDRTLLADPEGLFFAGNFLGVADTGSHRIVLYDTFENWPDESVTYSPGARMVVGQNGNYNTRKINNGQPEASASTLSAPVAASLVADELYVVDAGNNRLVVLPYQYGFFGAAVRVAGQDQFNLNSPNLVEGREFDFIAQTSSGTLANAGIVVDESSGTPRLYVADTYNNRILGFADARKVRPGDRADLVIGQPDLTRALCNYPYNDANKPTAGGLCNPTGLAVDAQGNLWVADTGNGRVVRFPAPFDNQGILPQANLVLGQRDFTTRITDPSSRTMSAPYGISFVGDSGLLVSDQTLNRVLFFPRVNGAFTTGMAATKVLGQPDFTSVIVSRATPAEDNRMYGPRGVSADTDGRAYVADAGNNRVLIFDTVTDLPLGDAHAVVQLAAGGARGVYVSPQTGEIWITDTTNNRCLRFVRFDQLSFSNFTASTSIPAASAALAVTQDQYGDLFVADGSNRVAIYYPGLTAVNGAHLLPNRSLTPGMVATLYPLGNQFGDGTAKYTDSPNPLPLPKELADVQVLVDDQPAPLFLASPGKINIQVPSSAPTTGTSEFQVIRKSTGQILAAASIPMNVAAPGLFTVNETGTGQVLANNQDGTANSATNRAARGSTVSLFGTGQGPLGGAPPDGEAPQGEVRTSEMPRVILGTCFVDDSACTGEKDPHITFSGLAPGLVGVWRIDIKIPMSTAPDSAVPVVVMYRSIYSNGSNVNDTQKVKTTIAVKQ